MEVAKPVLKWMLDKRYRSPDDPNTIDRNLMWMKHFVKGMAESIPNFIWVLAFQALARTLENWEKMDIMRITNLNQAYTVGREFGKQLFGGE